MNTGEHVSFWGFKVLNLSASICPACLHGWFVYWFLLSTSVAGLVLSMVFQLAHTVGGRCLPHALSHETTGKMEDEVHPPGKVHHRQLCYRQQGD
jgi:linoleoyl-CoA desaturase